MSVPNLKEVSTDDLLAELDDPARTSGLILSGGTADFAPALTIGQGLPSEIEGQPVKYWWKEVLVPGNYLDAKEKPFEITPERIELLASNFTKAKAHGFKPYIPSHHTDDSRANFGYILDQRINQRGGLELLHQIIGEDGFKAVARNQSSIFTHYNAKDADGNKYAELIDHNALVPNSRLTNLTGFQPALAASRGTTMAARVLTFAAPLQRTNDMPDLTKLREAIGAAKEVSDDDVLTQAIAKITTTKTALALSNTATTDATSQVTALTTRVTDAETKLVAANAKVVALELSNTVTPQPLLMKIGKTYESQIDQLVRECKATPAQSTLLKTRMKSGDKYDGLMLTNSETDNSPMDLAIKALSLNKPFTGSRSIGQTVTDPEEANDPKAVAKATAQAFIDRKYGKAAPAATVAK